MTSVNGILKTIGMVAVSSGILVGGFVLGTADEGPKSIAQAAPVGRYYQEGEIPAYPGSFEYPLGSDLSINDVRTRISYFYTSDSAETVRDFYVKNLSKTWFKPKVDNVSDKETNVYAVSRDGGNQISITIVSQVDRTLVFPAIIPISGKLLNGDIVKNRQNIPFSADAVGIMDISSRREEGAFLSYLEPKMDIVAALGHIRDDFGHRDWILEDYKQDVDGKGDKAFIQVKKGGEHLAFNIARIKGKSGVAITVNQIVSHD